MSAKTLPKEEQTNELITKSELARNLRVSNRTIDNWTRAGIIRKLKIGAMSRYDWPEVLAAVKANQG